MNLRSIAILESTLLFACLIKLVAPPAASAASDAATSERKLVGFLRDGSGLYPDVTPPIEWSADKNVVWKKPVGGGFGSPIVVGSSVIVTVEPDSVICVDIATGKTVWNTSTPVTALPQAQQGIVLPDPGQGGNMASTPCSDGERVYAQFGHGFVAAFDLKTGARVWTQAVDAPLPGDGRGASPVCVADLVIAHLSKLYAFNAKTGAIRWTQGEVQEGYGTPRVTKIGADEVLLMPKGGVVRVSDGKLLTTLASLMYASATLADDKICYIDTSINIYDVPKEPTDPLKLSNYWSDSIDGETYSTALYYDGLLYTLTKGGLLTILDVRSKTKSEKQLELDETVYSSPVLAGKYIYLCNDKGRTIIIEPGKEVKILKINELESGNGGTPTFSSKYMFIRTADTLYCINAR